MVLSRTDYFSEGQEEVLPGKDRLRSIVSRLVGLIKANSDYRLHDGSSG
jgi:hypothetical protein